MPNPHKPIAAVSATVCRLTAARQGRRSFARWAATEPYLAAWSSPAELAAACRSSVPSSQDPILICLLRLFPGDPLAQVTLLASLSRGLGSIVAAWARSGVNPGELDELEADLLSGCWVAAADLADRMAGGEPAPPRLGLWLLDRARQSVRIGRRRHRRTQERQESIPVDDTAAADIVRPVCDALASAIAEAVREGRITRAEAVAVFLTRVAGFDVGETARRLGTTPGTVRANRSRSERRLAGAA